MIFYVLTLTTVSCSGLKDWAPATAKPLLCDQKTETTVTDRLEEARAKVKAGAHIKICKGLKCREPEWMPLFDFERRP